MPKSPSLNLHRLMMGDFQLASNPIAMHSLREQVRKVCSVLQDDPDAEVLRVATAIATLANTAAGPSQRRLGADDR